MTTTTPTLGPTRSKHPWTHLLRAGLLAGIVAGVANTVIFFVARAMGAMPQDVGVGPAELPMTLPPIAVLGLVAAVAAVLLFGVLRRRTVRAVPVFLGLAAFVLILAAVPPLMIEGAPLGMVVALELMHVTVAASVIWTVLQLDGGQRTNGARPSGKAA